MPCLNNKINLLRSLLQFIFGNFLINPFIGLTVFSTLFAIIKSLLFLSPLNSHSELKTFLVLHFLLQISDKLSTHFDEFDINLKLSIVCMQLFYRYEVLFLIGTEIFIYFFVFSPKHSS